MKSAGLQPVFMGSRRNMDAFGGSTGGQMLRILAKEGTEISEIGPTLHSQISSVPCPEPFPHGICCICSFYRSICPWIGVPQNHVFPRMHTVY